jgi:hypothetical protein
MASWHDGRKITMKAKTGSVALTLTLAAALLAGALAHSGTASAATTLTQTVTLSTTSNSVGKQTQFFSALPSTAAVYLVSTSCTPLLDGSQSCTLTFANPNGYDVAITGGTCGSQPALVLNSSCTLTFVATSDPLIIGKVKTGKSTTFKVIVPPCGLVRAA